MEPKKKLHRRHLFFSLILTFILISLVCISFKYHLLEIDRVDLFLYDLHFKWRGSLPSSGKVVLVFLDQKSATELVREKGTWSRFHIARALDFFCRAGAEIVGVDLVPFSPSHNSAEDTSLSKAIDSCNNVVLAKFIPMEGSTEVNPLPIFQKGMIGDGFINMFPDKTDGVLRSMPFLSIKPLKEGLLNLDFTFDFSHEDHFRLGTEGPHQLMLPYPDLRINFLGGADAFPHFSFVDAVKGKIPIEEIKGKIILLGSTLSTEKDFFATPFTGHRGNRLSYKKKFGQIIEKQMGTLTPGVVCHAHALETILSQSFIRKASDKYVFALILLFGILGLLFYYQKPGPLIGPLILLFCVGLILSVSHQLFVRRLIWIEASPLMIILSIQFISGIAMQRTFYVMRTRFVTGLFGKYVSPSVVNDILEGEAGIHLKGQSKDLTILFSDLRGFTTISEGLTPEETGNLLNAYFDTMIPVIFDCKGTLDKLMGDAIMAFFGAPGNLENHAENAAEAALKMTKSLKNLKKGSKLKGIHRLEMGIGLNTGEVVVGNLGSSKFMDYTVIGDAVNLGSRIEGLNKIYGTSIIISQSTAEKLGRHFILRDLDRVKVKGKANAVTIYELVGFRYDIDWRKQELMEIFASGIEFYRDRKWKKAHDVFVRALRIYPNDGPSQLYLKRIEIYRKSPPPPQWDGTTAFLTK
jgi:adenylate cyclase